jgi:hypothetical protein
MLSRYRSSIKNDPAKKKELLKKIKSLKVVFQVGTARFEAKDCTGVAFDEEAAGGASPNVTFTRPGGSTPENYDMADIVEFRRLRSRRWLIVISGLANPA